MVKKHRTNKFLIPYEMNRNKSLFVLDFYEGRSDSPSHVRSIVRETQRLWAMRETQRLWVIMRETQRLWAIMREPKGCEQQREKPKCGEQ